MKEITIGEITNFLDLIEENFQFIGCKDDQIIGFSSLTNYKKDTITWIKNIEFIEENINKKIRLVVLPSTDLNMTRFSNVIMTNNPKRVFFSILSEFYGEKKVSKKGLNNVISNTARISEDINIGNNCTIGDNVEIGGGTEIFNNVVIANNVRIGKNCTIKSGSVIGEIGFGYSINDCGQSVRVPHFGSVMIGNNVDIGANTTIERGTLDDTIIEDNVKIDDLCQISHNVLIGENTNIITNTSVFGSVKIGKNCYISTSQIRNQVIIGDNVIVGMGAVVVKDVENNKVVAGVPAKVIRDNL